MINFSFLILHSKPLRSTENVVRKTRSPHDAIKHKVQTTTRNPSHHHPIAVNSSQNHRHHHHHPYPHAHSHHYQYYHGSHQYYPRPQAYPLPNTRPHKIPRVKEEKQSSPSLTPSSKASEPVQTPPKNCRSAFMCFTDAKKKELMKEKGISFDNDNLLRDVFAKAYKELSEKEKAFWDEEARNDKVRFVQESAAYKGPSTQKKKRAKKHPDAPKRPMSAFLKFSQTTRGEMKKANPDVQNTDISRLLGEAWRNMSEAEKLPYVEKEKIERSEYKEKMKQWKERRDREDAAAKTSHAVASPIFRQNQHQHRDCVPTIGARLDRLHIDSVVEDEATSKWSPFHPHPPNYYNIRPQYPGHDYFLSESHNQHAWPDLSMQHSMDHDPDPLPEVPGMPSSLRPVKNEDGAVDQQPNRNTYFPDSSYQFPQYL